MQSSQKDGHSSDRQLRLLVICLCIVSIVCLGTLSYLYTDLYTRLSHLQADGRQVHQTKRSYSPQRRSNHLSVYQDDFLRVFLRVKQCRCRCCPHDSSRDQLTTAQPIIDKDRYQPSGNRPINVERVPGAEGSYYTRWGRSSCPSNYVIAGHIAASMSGVSEGSSDLLCVPNSLQSPDFKYDMEEEPAVSQLTPALLSGRMVECVICTVTKPMTIMIPGRSQCPSDWSEEYAGLLVSGSHTISSKHWRTNHICLDSKPNLHPGPNPNMTLTLLTTRPGLCPSESKLCRDYQPEKDGSLPCVVCSHS